MNVTRSRENLDMPDFSLKVFSSEDSHEVVKLARLAKFDWSEKDFLTFSRQGKQGGYPSKIVLCLADRSWVAGAIGYEVLFNSIHIEFVLYHPSLKSEVFPVLLDYLKHKCAMSAKRRELFHLVEDTVSIKEIVPLWLGEKFSVSLVRGLFGVVDGWKLTWTAP